MKHSSFPITVLMSTYNDGFFLEKSIRSILEQSFSKFEFVIIDDGSSDETSCILKKYKRLDDRIILIKNENNLGLTKSLNLGIKIAKGRYIARMDGDDICHPQRLEKQYNHFKRFPDCKILASEGILINKYGKKIKNLKIPHFKTSQLNYLMNYSNPFIHSSIMYEKDLIFNLDCYDENYLTRQDLDLWLRATSAGFKIDFIRENLIFFRFHNNSISNINLDNLSTNILIRAVHDSKIKSINVTKKQIFLALNSSKQFRKYKDLISEKKKAKYALGLLGTKQTLYGLMLFLGSMRKFPHIFIQPNLKPIVEEALLIASDGSIKRM